MIKIYFDGACGPKNPGGTASFGFVIERNNAVIHSGQGVVGSGPGMSNNVAEYAGIIAAMECLISMHLASKKTLFLGDSKLVIYQLSKKWKAKQGLYKPYFIQASSLLKKFPNHKLRWVPRERNALADNLSKGIVC